MTLHELSQELSDRIDAVASAVVRVEGRRRGASSGVVWSADGVIVASHHAVELEDAVPVGLADGRTLRATIVGRDPGTDIALLRAGASGLFPLPWTDTSGVRLGQLAIGLSRPGRSLRAQIGVVGAVSDAWRTPSGGRIERYLESDMVPQPGYSGGPLLGIGGAGIGINTTGLLRGTGLTLPSETVRRIVDSLLARGHVRRGYLGIGTQPVALSADGREGSQPRLGLMVLSVQPDSPAAQAGLLLGDVLLDAGGTQLTQPAALLPLLDEEHVGQELQFELLRAGQRLTKTVVIGERSRS